MIAFDILHPQATDETLGYVPLFLSENDPRPAAEQFAENYIGGWRPFKGFKVQHRSIQYPGDPPRPLIAEAKLRNETIRFYLGAWVSITQPDGSVEISHMD